MENIVPKLLEVCGKYIWKKIRRSKPDRTYTLLCVELGHRRCKIALIKINSGTYSIEQIGDLTKTEPEETEKFLQPNGFVSFIDHVKQIQQRLQHDNSIKKVDGMALSLCCPTNSEDGVIDIDGLLGWSPDIREILHQNTGQENIVVVNDAVAFALGCQDDIQIIKGLKLPILCLTFGGGIGSSFIQNGKPINNSIIHKNKYFVQASEVGDIWKIWENGFEGNPHMLAGQAFFDWANNETGWDKREKKLSFSERIAWIIAAIREKGTHQFNSVIIGRGYATEYVDKSKIEYLQKKCKLSLALRTELPLYGIAKIWLQHFHYDKSISDLISDS